MELPEKVCVDFAVTTATGVPKSDWWFKIWISHGISTHASDYSESDDAGDPFLRRAGRARASFCRVKNQSTNTPMTVWVHIDPAKRTLDAQTWERAAVWITLYSRSRSRLDGNLGATIRDHGTGVIFLRDTDIEAGSMHPCALFNPTALDSSFAVDNDTFHKARREKYRQTAMLLVSIGKPIREARRGHDNKAALYPPCVMTEREDAANNKYILGLSRRYIQHGHEQQWHTYMYVAVPGNTVNLGVVTQLPYKTVPQSTFVAWTRHILSLESLSDDEFVEISKLATGPPHKDRAWAIMRMRWIAGFVGEPFSTLPYRSDTIGDRPGEYMGTNILTEDAGDCDNFAIPTYLFLRALLDEENIEYAPLFYIQKFLRAFRPVLTVMHTKSASHAGAASGAERESPCLHMVAVGFPETMLGKEFPDGSWENTVHPIMFEGTGKTGNFFCQWSRVYDPPGTTPDTISRRCRAYEKMQRAWFTLPGLCYMGAPTIPWDAPAKDKWAPAREDRFYSRVTNMVFAGDGAPPDAYRDLVARLEPGSNDTLPGVAFSRFFTDGFASVLYKRAAGHREFDPRAMEAVAQHVEPAPAPVIWMSADGETPFCLNSVKTQLGDIFSDMPLSFKPRRLPDNSDVLAPRTFWASVNIESRQDFATRIVPALTKFVKNNKRSGLFVGFEWDVCEVFATVYVLVVRFTLP